MARESFQRLRKLLDELFQFDRADLDFGLYRIMNWKREEIGRFLNEDLLPQVREALGTYRSAEREIVQAALEDQERSLRSLGMNEAAISEVPAIRDLRNKLPETADAALLEDQIYSDLYTFFSRYYKDGDFISLRRYKPGVYAIPYEGEEVKLYWANADQYYVKTSENFRDYRFRLSDGRHMHFRLVTAETERDNNKPSDGQERHFVLRSDEPVEEIAGELNVCFEYRPSAEKQAKINEATVKRLLGLPEIEKWNAALCAAAATGSNANRTLLEKHLADYTARNSFDYFVHKDLGGFLRRELDFFLKNEVLHIDDLDTDDERRATQYLARLRAIKQVGFKIIDFLAQLENFQKKLWLKRKFVVRAEYCVTLDRVPEELYPDIATNDAQREEWVRLFAIDEIKGNLMTSGYSNPLTVEFLRENPYLVLDTDFFDDCFKVRLLASFNNVDEAVDGLLIRGESFQALNLLRDRYRKQVACVYIDPPYNTGNDEFLYKDGYRSSSWLTFVEDRLNAVEHLLNQSAVFISVDDNQIAELRTALQRKYGKEAEFGPIIVQVNKGGRDYLPIAVTHEYIVCVFPKEERPINELPKSEVSFRYVDSLGGWNERELRNRNPRFNRDNRPNLYYPIYAAATQPDPDGFCPVALEPFPSSVEVWPLNSEGESSVWRWGKPRVLNNLGDGSTTSSQVVARQTREGKWNIYEKNRRSLVKAKSIWDESDVRTENGTIALRALFGSTLFPHPKPVELVQKCVLMGSDTDDVILDYLAGSGTTGHAVIKANHEDESQRKYILVEMGEYFDTVMKPRIQKVIYSKDWKDGSPVSREGSSQMFKYMTLESYEDALNNLEVRRPEIETVRGLFDNSQETHEDYMLRYMLDLETRGSASLLDLEMFEDPFNYQLRISEGGETHAMKVDLVETFNWLLGLRVQKMRAIDGYRTVEGLAPDGKRVLVIWRSLRDERHSNEALERFFAEQGYGKRAGDEALDRIYVNGDCTLANLRETADRWDVLLTEEEFKRLMFEPTGEGVLS